VSVAEAALPGRAGRAGRAGVRAPLREKKTNTAGRRSTFLRYSGQRGQSFPAPVPRCLPPPTSRCRPAGCRAAPPAVGRAPKGWRPVSGRSRARMARGLFARAGQAATGASSRRGGSPGQTPGVRRIGRTCAAPQPPGPFRAPSATRIGPAHAPGPSADLHNRACAQTRIDRNRHRPHPGNRSGRRVTPVDRPGRGRVTRPAPPTAADLFPALALPLGPARPGWRKLDRAPAPSAVASPLAVPRPGGPALLEGVVQPNGLFRGRPRPRRITRRGPAPTFSGLTCPRLHLSICRGGPARRADSAGPAAGLFRFLAPPGRAAKRVQPLAVVFLRVPPAPSRSPFGTPFLGVDDDPLRPCWFEPAQR